jgi:hypothetical protein
MAYDPKTGEIFSGVDPSAVEHEMPRFGHWLDAISHTLAPREDGIPMTFSAYGRMYGAIPTGREAEKGVSLAGGLGGALLSGIDPAKGGIGSVSIKPNTSDKTAEQVKASANVLMLPRDYSGPIFISDIDDTLRATNPIDIIEDKNRQDALGGPIPGAREILEGVAKMGVPIVYLSAGTTAIHSENADFLKQFPKGILLDNQDWHFSIRDLSNHDSALDQAAYKQAVIERIKATYPNAKLIGIGDDKYGDAIAYTNTGVKAFIHDVKPDHANIPKGFSGETSPAYTTRYIDDVLGAVRAALVG